MTPQSSIEVVRLLADMQRDSRSGTVYVLVLATVRGAERVFVRDRASHGVVKMPGEVILAVAQNGHTDYVRNVVVTV